MTTTKTTKLPLDDRQAEEDESDNKITKAKMDVSSSTPESTSTGGPSLDGFYRFGPYSIFTLILYELMLMPAVLVMTIMVSVGMFEV